MTRPRIVLPSEPGLRVRPLYWPFVGLLIWISSVGGHAVQLAPGWVRPSMTTGTVIGGSWLPTLIVCKPLPMAKEIVVGLPLPLNRQPSKDCWLFAAMIASRKLHRPSLIVVSPVSSTVMLLAACAVPVNAKMIALRARATRRWFACMMVSGGFRSGET